jgi:hypothetical protein
MANSKQAKICAHWCFTWNNPTLTSEQFRNAINDEWKASYAIFRPEKGENGTPHFQGYVEWPGKAGKRFTAVRKLLPTGHWESRAGTREEARAYCMDIGLDGTPKPGGTGPVVEVGVWTSAAQGRRSDLEGAAQTLRDEGWRAMIENHPTAFIKYPTGMQAYAMELGDERTTPPTVVLFYGPSGCGKTRLARSYAPHMDRWIAPIGCNGGWFNGYHGQPLAILDDFAGKLTGYRLDDCLRLFDRYELTVPVKGSFAQWAPDMIVVTTNIHPSRWWDYSDRLEHFTALKRRFTMVFAWERDGRRRILEQVHPQWDAFWSGPAERVRAVLPGPGGLADWVQQPDAPDEYSFLS